MLGLECNLQKSNVLLIGDEPVLTDEMRDTGFSLKDSITVLGFTLTNTDELLSNNTSAIVNKVINQVQFWSRLNLSLPGQINICKSMLYSQMNYIDSVLPVPENLIARLEDIIYTYAKGNLNISAKRTFLPIKLGGLGLFGIKNFLDDQKCSWIRKCKNLDQDWKIVLIKSGMGKIACVNDKKIDSREYPILLSIAEACNKFRTTFTQRDNNFLKSYILNNQALPISFRTKLPFTETDVDPEIQQNPENFMAILRLKMEDLIADYNMVNKVAFIGNLGFNISQNMWEKLDKMRRAAKTRYGKDPANKSQSLCDFIKEWKSGSKSVRKILENNSDIYLPHNMIKFAENSETLIDSDQSCRLNKLWEKNFLSVSTRTFVFKMHNNTLPLNTVLSHFVRGINRNCTFCDLIFNPDEEDENFLHFFYMCEISERIREQVLKNITGDRNFTVSRQEFFVEFKYPNNFRNEALQIITILIRKFLWDCRQRKTLPILDKCIRYLADEVKIMRKINLIA
jgi:hypothetical protein